MQLQLVSYLCAFLYAFNAINVVNGVCQDCSVTTNLACISQTQFQVCINGTPSGDIAHCPTDYVCSTIGAGICQLNTTAVLGDCADCNVCDVNRTFACTGLRTYALCLNTQKPSILTGSCETDHFCSTKSDQICVNATSGFSPSCTYIDESTIAPTPSPTGDPNGYCSLLAQRGRFPVGTNPATTCRQYVLCLQNGETWVGALYYCAKNAYFNENTGSCVQQQPARCNSLTGSLSIHGIQYF